MNSFEQYFKVFRSNRILPFLSGWFPHHPGYVVNPDDCHDNFSTDRQFFVTATTIFQLPDNFLSLPRQFFNCPKIVCHCRVNFFIATTIRISEKKDNIVLDRKSTLLFIASVSPWLEMYPKLL